MKNAVIESLKELDDRSTRTTPSPVVLVGCGAVSQQFYAPALRCLEDSGTLQVVALVDPAADARGVLAARFPQARSVAALVSANAPRGSLAIVASPPRVHSGQTIDAFERGWHVLCEKPMAPTAGECEEMIRVAERTDRMLAIGHYKRFFPNHRLIGQLIARRTFGFLREVSIHEGGKFGWPAASGSFFRKEQTPGGVLLDLGVHVLDLLLWWLGEPSAFTYADDAMDGLEANCLMRATFGMGTQATVRLSRDWKTTNTYTFRFEAAVLHLRVNQANRVEITLDGIPISLAGELREQVSDRYPIPTPILETNAQAFTTQLSQVLKAIEHRDPMVSGRDGMRTIRWIEACYRSRQKLGWKIGAIEECG